MKIPTLLLPLALLAGCVSVPDRQPAPASVEVRERWQAPNLTNGVVSSWWTTFGSAQVVGVVNEALARNFDLQVAFARMEAAAANARIAGADLYPTVNAAFDANRNKRNFIGFPIPGGGDSVLSSESTTYGLNLATSWELDLWGRVRAGKQSALAELQASEADYIALQHSIAAQTVRAWLATVELNRQLALTTETVASYEKTVRQIERRYERGLTPSLDYRLALTDLEAGRANLADRKAQRERAVRQLQFLLGRYPDGLTEVQVEFPALAREIPAGLPSELLARRPDLIAAERRLAASLSRVKEARGNLYPRISLTASGGTSTDDLSSLLDSGFTVWTLAANAMQPLFQGGRIVAGIDFARSANHRAVAEYGRSILQAFTEVETALAVERDLAERESHLAEAARQARGSLARAEERYASGLESILAVLQAQRNTFNAESALINVQRVRLDNRIDLHLALGGGFPVELNPPLPAGPLTSQISQTE